MRKFLFLIVASIIFISCNSKTSSSQKTIIEDDLHHQLNLKLPITKAVSLAPNLTEIIYFIGAENLLAANTLYCNFPPDAKKKPKIGDLVNIDFEKLLKINPDVVLMTTEGNNKAQYNKIKSLGFKVFVSDLKSFEDILRTIKTYGKFFGKEKTAEEKTRILKIEYDSLRSTVENRPSKTALFLISVHPLIAAGKNTFINEYLTACGLQNSLGKTKVNSYPIINIEELIKENPDFIMLPKNVKSQFEELVNQNFLLQKLKAVQNSGLIYVNPDLYFRPGPRFTDALKDLIEKLNSKKK